MNYCEKCGEEKRAFTCEHCGWTWWSALLALGLVGLVLFAMISHVSKSPFAWIPAVVGAFLTLIFLSELTDALGSGRLIGIGAGLVIIGAATILPSIGRDLPILHPFHVWPTLAGVVGGWLLLSGWRKRKRFAHESNEGLSEAGDEYDGMTDDHLVCVFCGEKLGDLMEYGDIYEPQTRSTYLYHLRCRADTEDTEDMWRRLRALPEGKLARGRE